MLLALYHFIKDQEDWLTPLLVATTNQKCVLVLGMAIGIWLLLNKANWRVFVNKTLAGLLVGMILLYAYGLAIHPSSLLMDQFQRHGIDRLLHQNPNKGDGLSFFPASGPCSPLTTATRSSCWRWPRRRFCTGTENFPRAMVLVFLIAATALLFSLVDWKMTKHLDLMVRPSCWSWPTGSGPLVAVSGKYRGAVWPSSRLS